MPVERKAAFTNRDHSEIELTHPFEGVAGHQDNGKKMLAYYDANRYAAKQAEHGHLIYPEPTPFKP